MKDIVIIGAGGFGREVQWLLERINEKQNRESGKLAWNILGYIDDGVEVGTEINGYRVLGGCDYLINQITPLAVTCAICASKTRKKVIKKIRANRNLSFPNLIDPSAQMSERIEWGVGNIVCGGSILTVNVKIADFCIVNLNCTVGHGNVLSSFVTTYPCVNISGSVNIGECTELGEGVQIIKGKNIGAGTIIGAGAVVIKDLPDDCTAAGSPCKSIKFYGELTAKGLLILGASGHGKVVADIATSIYENIQFIDDAPGVVGKVIQVSGKEIPVVGDHTYAVIHKGEYDVFVAVGNANIRQRMNQYYTENGLPLVSLIHPDAVVASDVMVCPGTVIMAGAVVNSGSRLGEGVIINTGATVDHDNFVGNYSHISVGAHLAGTVKVGDHTWVGAGTVVSNNITVCNHCMIGAGAVVVKNIEYSGTYIGIPAKLIKPENG